MPSRMEMRKQINNCVGPWLNNKETTS